jgi:hypothetical protein
VAGLNAMTRPFHTMLGLLVLAFGVGASPVFAQNAAKSSAKTQPVDEYSYNFEVDFLDGNDLKGDGPRITVRGGAARVLLIRPRTSFAAELIKSAENL